MNRKELISKCKRIVIKIGSGVLTHEKGLDRRRIYVLAGQIAHIHQLGLEVVVVSSGAIASGRSKMKLEKTLTLPQKQAAAALGQAGLMQLYEDALDIHNLLAAQLLLTGDDLRSRQRYRNIYNTIETLLSWGAVPVINENDTVAVQEIKLGDNDNLAAMLTTLLGAELLINLTNVDGLFADDPRINPQAKLIPLIERVEALHLLSASNKPNLAGTGGILSKLKAADKVARGGAYTIIANGCDDNILTSIINGEEKGTLFLPRLQHLSSRKHWIAFTSHQAGQIVLDQGAVGALRDNGKSLLAAGVKDVLGDFNVGDTLRVLSPEHNIIGVGLTNYDSQELNSIKGLRTHQIATRLGRSSVPEVMHRDNMVIFDWEDGENLQCLLNQ